MDEIQLRQVDYVSVGALGEPGHRTFMVQGVKNDETISIVVEKYQIQTLSEQAIDFLDSLIEEFPDEAIATPEDFEIAGKLIDIPASFRAQSMSLEFDPETMQVILELRETPNDEDFEPEIINLIKESGHDHVAKLIMSRTQLRAMAVRGREAVQAGREQCPLCQMPMNISGHSCPRLN